MTKKFFPLDVNGYHFINWTNAGRQLGYRGPSLKHRYERMKDTNSLEEIFVPKEETIFPLDVNGYHFVSWKDAGRQLGYSDGSCIQTHYNQMKDTHSLEEIFVPKEEKETIFPLDINGYHFESWEDAGRQLGYSRGGTVKQRYDRMKDTHSLEEIFVPKEEKETIFPLDVNGYHFESWRDANRQLGYLVGGLELHKLYDRMKDTHSLEEIFVPKYERKTFFPLDVNGYHFIHWSDTAKQLGYSEGKQVKQRYDRMKDTHSLEEIFVPKEEKETIFPLDLNGYHFTSWVDAARQLGYANPGVLNERYISGWSLMETFGFSLHLLDDKRTIITPLLFSKYKISDNLYKCKNKETGLLELHTYEELNEIWREFKGVKIVKE